MTGKLHRSDRHAAPDDSGFAGGKNKGLKKVKQSNHNIYTIPYGMEPWADEPLYLVVARWGLQLKRWINRNDIAAVFHIPSWRRICKVILRNDYWCRGLSFSPTRVHNYRNYMARLKRQREEWGLI
ncbi:CaiF/GrlA family transcriptional regulator [Salmonella enterica]|nr:CaiF/GrlA family transcriptional regulator [Salmonella enterica]